MSRLLRFCQHLAISALLLLTQVATAQPTVISERKNVPRWTSGMITSKALALPGRRFVHCGQVAVRVPGGNKQELMFLVSTAAGDTVRYRRLNLIPVQVPSIGDYFLDVVLGPDFTLTFLSRSPVPNSNPTTFGFALTKVDTLGNVRWRRVYPTYPAGTVLSATALLWVPDGYLVLTNAINTVASTPLLFMLTVGSRKLTTRAISFGNARGQAGGTAG